MGNLVLEWSKLEQALLKLQALHNIPDNATFQNDGTDEAIYSEMTNTDGQYVILGIANGTYVVKPRFQGYGFSPLLTTITSSGADVTDVNFWGMQGLYISGKVVNSSGSPQLP